MTKVLITTVGTSLLTNREDDRPWKGWNGRGGDPLPEKSIVDNWLITASLEAASAETNTLRAITPSSNEHIVFLHSDTPEGRFCSNRLRRFYEQNKRYANVSEKPIAALGYHHDSFAQKGLRSLVSVAVGEIHQATQKAHARLYQSLRRTRLRARSDSV